MSFFTIPKPDPPEELSKPPSAPDSQDLEQHDGPPATGGTSPMRSSKKSSTSRLDNLFNFQIVVFEVEDTLFQVLKNGFNVPGTIFEAMFALPVPAPESDIDDLAVEGSTLENPIYLADVSATDFRAFLRLLYPFIGPAVPFTYEDWVGILNLSTKWDFRQLREKAISNLSTMIGEKPAQEKIFLGRTYRVSKWLRDEYVRLAQKPNIDLGELRDPLGISLDWETIAKVLSVHQQNTFRNLKEGRLTYDTYCHTCGIYFGYAKDIIDCRCRLPSVVDSVFHEEFQGMSDPAEEDSLPAVLSNFTSLDLASSGKKKKMKKGSAFI